MSSNVIARYVDKRSGKDTSLACLDRNFVPAPPVWLREEIQRDMGATGIIKIGDQGRHSEDKVTPVESNHRKCTVVWNKLAGRRRRVWSNLAAKLPSTTEEEQTDRNFK